MKTASRIVGTAAVLEGLVAQDSPVYGAERRGAPLSAYVRIARTPIFERGLIPAPDLVVVADDTLLDDPAVRPLAGLGPTGALLLATAHGADAVRAHTGHPGPVVARDFLGLALAEVGTAAAVSTALGVAAGVLAGLGPDAVTAAVRGELAALGLPAPAIDAGLRLADLARAGLAPLALGAEPHERAGADGRVVDVAWAPAETGAPTIVAAPNTPLRRTGSWRLFRPVIDLERCTRCWICFVRCPDGAIRLLADDTPRVDYEVCKGCLICLEECPPRAIRRERETRTWAAAGAAR